MGCLYNDNLLHVGQLIERHFRRNYHLGLIVTIHLDQESYQVDGRYVHQTPQSLDINHREGGHLGLSAGL